MRTSHTIKWTLIAALCLSVFAPGSFAQEMGPQQMMMFSQLKAVQIEQSRQTVQQLKVAEKVMQAYAATHDRFPGNISEFDDCLRQLVAHGNLNESDIQTRGKFRTAQPFAICVDPSFVSVPIINGVPKVPENFCGLPSTVVIMTDGDKNCVGWVAGADGKPVAISDKGPAYFSSTIAHESSETLDIR